MAPVMIPYVFYDFSLPATTINGISSAGLIVGESGINGLTFTFSNGSYKTIYFSGGPPLGFDTGGINDQGQVVGQISHFGPGAGFLYSDGTLTSFRNPDAHI